MKNIIVISGKQYSGKDTLAKLLLEKLEDYKRIGIGDSIKLMFAKKNNLTLDEIEKNKHIYRIDLIKLGNRGRSKDKYYWLDYLSGLKKIIVPDVRVPDELDFFKKKGAFLIRVEADYDVRSKRGVLSNDDDYTETALDDYENWDIKIKNNSNLEQLKIKADEIINILEKTPD